MTREEKAINELINAKEELTDETIYIAIKAIELCKNAVNKQIINELQKYRYNCGETSVTCVSLKSINELPSII